MKSLLSGTTDSKAIIVTVNAGHIPSGHWTQDERVGGGRILGEACHFVDLLRFLVGAPIVSANVVRAGQNAAPRSDTVSFSLSFADGSLGTVHYFASGNRSFPKERIEVFCSGRILQLDNFRTLRGWGWPNFRMMKRWRQDKGANNMVEAFLASIRKGKPAPIPFEEILEVARTTVQIASL